MNTKQTKPITARERRWVLRHSVGNRALIIDACVGMDLLIENAERRFGFPVISPEQEATPEALRQHGPDELTLETPSSEPASSPRPETSITAQFTPS